MSEANPKIGIDALLPTAKKVGDYTIRPIKLGTIAILEKIESPVCTGAEMSLFNMLPTIFVMVHDYRTTLMSIDQDTFPEDVMNWADSLDDNLALELQNACLDAISEAFIAGPVTGDSESSADPLVQNPPMGG